MDGKFYSIRYWWGGVWFLHCTFDTLHKGRKMFDFLVKEMPCSRFRFCEHEHNCETTLMDTHSEVKTNWRKEGF